MTENIQQFLERFHTDGCADAYRFLGCHCLPSGGAIFRVWAPRAESVSVVGEFDPGSGRTLAACLTHASRTRIFEQIFSE